MLAIDLLKKANFDVVADIEWDNMPSYEKIRYEEKELKEAYKKFVKEKILTIEPKPDTKGHIFLPTTAYYDEYDDDGNLLPASLSTRKPELELYYKDEIKEKFKPIEGFSEKAKKLLEEANNKEAIWELLRGHHEYMPEAYAYDFTPWDEILGYEVDNDAEFGDINAYAQNLIYEITFHGWLEETRDERRNELEKAINETEELMKLPKEEREKHFISSDDLWKKLGVEDKRTKEQKDAEELQVAINSLKSALSNYNALEQYVNKQKIIAKNKELVAKYPFLYPRDDRGEKIAGYDYSWTELDGWPEGWVKAFGEEFASDLWEALKKTGKQDEYYVQQVKEKFGQSRWYGSWETEEMSDIIYKYEHISEHTCIHCGKYPVNLLNDGWVSPWCFECWSENYKERTYNKEDDLSDEALQGLYSKWTVERAEDASSIAKYSRFSKEGRQDVELDCSDIIERMMRKKL